MEKMDENGSTNAPATMVSSDKKKPRGGGTFSDAARPSEVHSVCVLCVSIITLSIVYMIIYVIHWYIQIYSVSQCKWYFSEVNNLPLDSLISELQFIPGAFSSNTWVRGVCGRFPKSWGVPQIIQVMDDHSSIEITWDKHGDLRIPMAKKTIRTIKSSKVCQTSQLVRRHRSLSNNGIHMGYTPNHPNPLLNHHPRWPFKKGTTWPHSWREPEPASGRDASVGVDSSRSHQRGTEKNRWRWKSDEKLPRGHTLCKELVLRIHDTVPCGS